MKRIDTDKTGSLPFVLIQEKDLRKDAKEDEKHSFLLFFAALQHCGIAALRHCGIAGGLLLFTSTASA